MSGGSEPAGAKPQQPEPPRGDAPTYEGSRFPWWLTALWVVFLVWGAVYLLTYFLPDLKTWLPGR
jgi:hypothetical protein